MDKEIKESVISGPLLHWAKVAILTDCLIRLKQSNKMAFGAIDTANITAYNREITEEERDSTVDQLCEIMQLNTENILKTKKLLERATEMVPEGMRSWPTLN